MSKIIELYISGKVKIMNGAAKNDIKISSITENLIIDPTNADKYKFSIFEILSNV